MDETDVVTHRRIEVVETLLGFEAPEDAVIGARAFLMSVFDNKEESISDRMEAIKIAHKSEAPKVTSQIIRLEVNDRSERERREAWRHYEKSQLKMKIWRATGNTRPEGWCDHLATITWLRTTSGRPGPRRPAERRPNKGCGHSRRQPLRASLLTNTSPLMADRGAGCFPVGQRGGSTFRKANLRSTPRLRIIRARFADPRTVHSMSGTATAFGHHRSGPLTTLRFSAALRALP
jgi:hypothetical protein